MNRKNIKISKITKMQAIQKQEEKRKLILPAISILVVVFAIIIVTIINNIPSTNSKNKVGNEDIVIGNGIVVDTTSLSNKVKFFDYVANGTKMQVMSVLDSNGKARVALNTCQTCNGSPYAYFIQDGEYVVCQNCGQYFAIDVMGDVKDGCNPVPIEYNIDEDNIIIIDAMLKQYAALFTNWKKGL